MDRREAKAAVEKIAAKLREAIDASSKLGAVRAIAEVQELIAQLVVHLPLRDRDPGTAGTPYADLTMKPTADRRRDRNR